MAAPPGGGGDGAAGEARSAGYGRELIEHALPYQLGAETHYELGPDGMRCTIAMPVAADQAAQAGTS